MKEGVNGGVLAPRFPELGGRGTRERLRIRMFPGPLRNQGGQTHRLLLECVLGDEV